MPTLDLINLRKQFGSVTNPVVAVNDLNINVADGEFLCILGPSGCGKSTALRMVAGFEEPSGGDVQIDQQSIINMPPNKRPTAMVFQKYTLWPHMKVYDNIAFGLKLRHLPKNQIDQEVQASLELVGLGRYGDRYPAQLSGGEQQRVAIARALVTDPLMLLADEPTGALDTQTSLDIMGIFQKLNDEGITLIVVTHEPDIAEYAERRIVFRDGRVIEDAAVKSRRRAVAG
jgi:putative ABC transport system ATP-binding protein